MDWSWRRGLIAPVLCIALVAAGLVAVRVVTSRPAGAYCEVVGAALTRSASSAASVAATAIPSRTKAAPTKRPTAKPTRKTGGRKGAKRTTPTATPRPTTTRALKVPPAAAFDPRCA